MNAERLRELLDYDPHTGVFLWAASTGPVGAGKIAGCIHRGYRRINIDGRKYRAGRLAWLHIYGHWPSDQIDHINGIRDDDRLDNLREATNQENAHNQRHPMRNSKGKMLGVWPSGRNFIAKIKINEKAKYLGTFATDVEAHAAYLTAKRRFHPSWRRSES